jgi:hypothetical protein
MRARPAMILADSSRQTASTARCASGTLTQPIRSPACAAAQTRFAHSGP